MKLLSCEKIMQKIKNHAENETGGLVPDLFFVV